MKLINTVTNEVIAEITANRSMDIDSAIRIFGEIFPANENENVLIDGEWYYYEDLDLI